MIELRDKDKNRVAGLVDYENLCIESVLESGDKTLSFYYPKKGKYYDEIVEEAYIRTKKDEFVVKARELDDEYTKFECSLNLEELEGNIFDRFESVEQTITSALNLAVVGTGWTVKDNTLKKRRTVRCTNKSSLEIVREIKKVYRVDIVFNTLGKQIEVYEHLGEDKGTYFIDSLNLIALQVQSDSRQYATRIIAEGKDGLSFSDINNGRNYVENYQYSNKVKTIYWKDERYSVKENLLEDARAKLEELSKPFRSYSASILNLAELNPRYSSILDFKLGDAINLISKKNKIKDKQRIVKTIEWPQDHTKDSVELANATLKFEDIQQENQETSDTVSNITTDNGTINGSTIDSITTKQIEDFEANVIKVAKLKAILAEIENLHVNKADIQNLNAVIAKIGTLEATKASIAELNAIHAIIQQLKVGKADIADLNAAVAKVGILENKTAVLENALAGNLTADNFKANSITATSGIIADGAIGDAQISSLSGNKLRFGTIDTSLVTVAGPNGRLKILGNKLQIFDDVNNRLFERIMLGINDKNRACLTLRATDGQTVLLTEEGLTKAGITDGFGKADDNSLSALKLDKNSIVRQVNGATETIKGTRIQVGDRTLDVELSTQKNTITEHGKELSSQKATIQALDNAIKLKVDSQTFTQSTTTINNNINKAKEEAINSANSNTTNAINNIQIGGVNLLISNLAKTYPNNVGLGTENKRNDESISYVRILSDSKKHISVFGATIGEILKDKFILNQKYTISCEVRIPTEGYVGFYAGTPVNHVLANKWTKISYTFVGTSNNVRVVGFEYSGTQLDYRNLKLEEGEFATDYSLAPEDVKKYSDDVAKAKSDLAKTEAIANADGKITAEEQKRIVEAKKNLDIAIAKSEKAKADAINTASADATNKANNALNSAKAFVNSEINTVNTHLSKNTSEINILKEKIESKVSQTDIDKSISAIQIGGRNLIRNSNFKNGLNFFNINGTGKGSIELVEFQGRSCLKLTNIADYRISKYLGLVASGVKKGRNITVSADFYIEKGDTLCFDTSHGLGVEYLYFNFKEHNKWQRLSITSSKKTTDNGEIRFAVYGKNENPITIYISLIKIEEGTTATDWTPAPEDIDKSITDNIKIVTDKISTVESNLTQTKSSIEANVKDLKSKTESITTNVSNINRDLTNKINSNLDVAKNFATDKANEALNSAKSYTNAEITTVNSKVHNVESNLNILSDRINSKVSQSDVDKSISNIIIGGRNLFLDSDLQVCTKSKNWFDNFKSLVTTENNLNYATMRGTQWFFGQYVELEEGQTYTASCLARVNKASQLKSFLLHIKLDAITGLDYAINKPCTDNFQRISYTFVWSRANARERIHFLLRDSSAIVDIALIKLEKGNKATDWSPAPEDVNTLVTDSIKIVDSKISDVSSNVTQLRDSVTTQINSINSKTHSIETNLGGKASKQEVTEVNNRVATIKASLDGITQRVSATESKTQTLESDLNGKASKQEVNNVSSKVVSLEANLNGITNRVSSTETVTKSLNDKLWETTNKLNNVEQRITPISIINTVSSAYYKKGEVDNVFSTKSEVEQLDNRINYKFSNTGYSNLIFNGNFANGTVHWRNWGNCSLVSENGQLTVRAKQSSNNANIGAVSSAFVLEKGKKYSLTFQGCSSWNIPWLNYIYLLGEDGVNHRLDLRIDINSADLVYRTATFTAPATKWVRLLIGVEGYLQTDVSGFKLVDVCLVEGDIPRRFVPNANEISEGATSIDSNGVIVRHTNGSYTSMTLGGFEWKTKGMSKAYHCLAETGWVNISTGAWLGDHYDIKITLPEYFRGKVFTPCSMIQGWYVESNFSLNQLVVNIPYETINYSEGSFVIRVKALTRDGVFQRNINISWLAIA